MNVSRVPMPIGEGVISPPHLGVEGRPFRGTIPKSVRARQNKGRRIGDVNCCAGSHLGTLEVEIERKKEMQEWELSE